MASTVRRARLSVKFALRETTASLELQLRFSVTLEPTQQRRPGNVSTVLQETTVPPVQLHPQFASQAHTLRIDNPSANRALKVLTARRDLRLPLSAQQLLTPLS